MSHTFGSVPLQKPEMLNSVCTAQHKSLLSFQMHVDNADLLWFMLAVDFTNAPRERLKNQMMRLWRVIANIFSAAKWGAQI